MKQILISGPIAPNAEPKTDNNDQDQTADQHGGALLLRRTRADSQRSDREERENQEIGKQSPLLFNSCWRGRIER